MKQLVAPFIDEIAEEDVSHVLELMAERQLIAMYTDDTGRPLIQVLDWWDWQTGLRYKVASRYQAPEGWEDRVTPREDDGRFATRD